MRAACIAVLIFAAPLAGQAPGTDIYLVSLSRSGTGLSLGAPVNATARAGYDNQPYFSADGRSVFYTSQRDGQTDIFRYDRATGSAVQVTSTAESEYSPTVMPDGRRISVIRVEKDSTQRLWAFTLDGTAVRPLLDSIKPVGYHTWLNADTVFVFVLGSPATLRRAELGTGTAQVMASNIGRALAVVPGRRAVSFVQQDSASGWVRTLDPVTGAGESIVRLPSGASFFTWLPSGELLTATGNRLLLWKQGAAEWVEVTRFSEPGLQQISRLAVSPAGDALALVGNEPAPARSP
jgi:dipeptidyl aminopeptidase/acylaminoacyl peptidase